MKNLERAFNLACEQYDKFGVNVNKALKTLSKVAISLQCWQGDDVGGFETTGAAGGGIMATGNYPGRARTPEELRADLEEVYKLLPGKHRLSLHASYLENGGKKVDRNEIQPKHYAGWVEWAKRQGIGMDFNQTLFSHPKAASGFTLSNYDKNIRNFWIEHSILCRKVAEYIGKELASPCVTNLWAPDGYKDIPIDRMKSRELLKDSLDKVFAEKLNHKYQLDAVESKLFGIGVESCTIGSHEFYLGYAIKNGTLLTLDTGHYHPTEVVSDKISSVLCYIDELLLHVSRPVRWDSDHVVILDDELKAIASEIVRGNFIERVHIGLDFFDASINRVAAWVIGTRCMIKAILIALLEPTEMLRNFEITGDYTSRLAMLEELKTLPFGVVWDYYCFKNNVPVGMNWMEQVKRYEKEVLAPRR